jgi:hypothetical protein
MTLMRPVGSMSPAHSRRAGAGAAVGHQFDGGWAAAEVRGFSRFVMRAADGAVEPGEGGEEARKAGGGDAESGDAHHGGARDAERSARPARGVGSGDAAHLVRGGAERDPDGSAGDGVARLAAIARGVDARQRGFAEFVDEQRAGAAGFAPAAAGISALGARPTAVRMRSCSASAGHPRDCSDGRPRGCASRRSVIVFG